MPARRLCVDLASVDISWLRRQVGVVLQKNLLFNASVRANIALADPAMSMDRIIAAAIPASAHEFVLELPEGYDTIVGERGSCAGAHCICHRAPVVEGCRLTLAPRVVDQSLTKHHCAQAAQEPFHAFSSG
jgi:hypothetical protein